MNIYLLQWCIYTSIRWWRCRVPVLVNVPVFAITDLIMKKIFFTRHDLQVLYCLSIPVLECQVVCFILTFVAQMSYKKKSGTSNKRHVSLHPLPNHGHIIQVIFLFNNRLVDLWRRLFFGHWLVYRLLPALEALLSRPSTGLLCIG